MNNWYNRINRIVPQPVSERTIFQNPMQRAQFVMNAMRNPVAFIREQFPDVPNEIQNNPDAVLSYLQQTRGQQFSQQMQQLMGPNVRR